LPSAADEPVEEIDGSGRVLRTVTRRQVRAENLLHRNVMVVVRRSSGAIVVHQRSDWKDVSPSLWDLAFGGIPNVGESDEAAAVRELAEETGLEVEPSDLTDLGRAEWSDDTLRWIGSVFEVIDDREIEPVDGEVVAIDEVLPIDLANWSVEMPVCPDTAWVLVPRLAV
jgi:8-oxo-dGTP pyrophosphatase MutT (NUDIX family)